MSNLFTLNWQDLLKGLAVAFLTVVLGSLLQILQAGAWPTLPQLQTTLITGLTAAIAYIIKNALSNNQGTMLSADVSKATMIADIKALPPVKKEG